MSEQPRPQQVGGTLRPVGNDNPELLIRLAEIVKDLASKNDLSKLEGSLKVGENAFGNEEIEFNFKAELQGALDGEKKAADDAANAAEKLKAPDKLTPRELSEAQTTVAKYHEKISGADIQLPKWARRAKRTGKLVSFCANIVELAKYFLS